MADRVNVLELHGRQGNEFGANEYARLLRVEGFLMKEPEGKRRDDTDAVELIAPSSFDEQGIRA